MGPYAEASADGDFITQEANQQASAMAAMAGAMGTPWSQFEAGLAAAKAAWAPTEAADLATYESALGAAEVAYTSADAAQYVTMAEAVDAADQSAADASADADEAQTDAVAADEATFEETLAPAVESYQAALADATAAQTIAIAQAVHDYDLGGTSADELAALAAANATFYASQVAAGTAYSTAYGTASAAQSISDAGANLTDEKAQADAALADSKSAAQAEDVYTDAEAADYDTEEKADDAALAAQETADASSYATAVQTFDQNNPSPWADQASAQANAALNLQLATSNQQLLLADAMADFEETAETATSDAQAAWSTAQAQAQHDQQVAMDQADHDLTVSQGESLQTLATAGAYTTAPPDVPQAPAADTPLTLTGDYGHWHPIGEYEVGNTTASLDGNRSSFDSIVDRTVYPGHDNEPFGTTIATIGYSWMEGGQMAWGILAPPPPTPPLVDLPGEGPVGGSTGIQWASGAGGVGFGPNILAQTKEAPDGGGGTLGEVPAQADSNPTDNATGSLNRQTEGQNPVREGGAKEAVSVADTGSAGPGKATQSDGKTIYFSADEMQRDGLLRAAAPTLDQIAQWGANLMQSAPSADWNDEVDRYIAEQEKRGAPLEPEVADRLRSWIGGEEFRARMRAQLQEGLNALGEAQAHADATYEGTYLEGVIKGAVETAAVATVGVVVVVAVAAASPVLAVVVVVGAAGYGLASAAGERLDAGQSLGEASLGALGSVTGVGGVYTGVTGNDFGTFEDLGLTPNQQGQAFGGGTVQVVAIIVGGRAGFKGSVRGATIAGEEVGVTPRGFTLAFRAVSEAEYQDILATGRLRQGPNSLEGKWFADSLEGAQAHGRAWYPDGRFRLIEVDIPDNAASLFRDLNLDGLGPARYIHNDELPWLSPRPLE